MPKSTPAPSPTVSGLSMHPRTFKARRGTRIRFRLSAAATVTLRVGEVAIPVRGHAGVNTVRFRKRLNPGTYRLKVASASVKFRVVR